VTNIFFASSFLSKTDLALTELTLDLLASKAGAFETLYRHTLF